MVPEVLPHVTGAAELYASHPTAERRNRANAFGAVVSNAGEGVIGAR